LGKHGSYPRAAGDHYPTPDWAIAALAEHVDLAGQLIWEPACGAGRMAEARKAAGATVHCSDVESRGFPLDALIDFILASHRTALTARSALSATQPSAAKARSLNASSRPAAATPLAADSSPCYSLPTSIPQKPARASVAIARHSPPRSCSRAELRGSRIPIPTGSGRRKIIPGVSGDIRRFGRLR